MNGEAGRVPEGWREVKLGDVLQVLKDGTHFSPQEFLDEGRKYITSKNIRFGYMDLSDIQYVSEEVHAKIYKGSPVKKGDVLLTKDGANTGNVAINNLEEEFSLLSSVAILRGRGDSLQNEYLFQHLMSPKTQNFIQGDMAGQAITRLTLQKIGRFPLLLPPLPEQRKIASILSTWDDSLATLTNLLAAKRQQKRGLAEALLTGKKRLPGFEGEWEAKRLGEVFTRITRKNTEGNEHALTISGTLGLIDQREFFNKRVAAADLSGYYLIRRGEFAYNKSYSAGYAYGAIKRLNRYDAGVVSTLYICFALTQADANSDFYEQFFEAGLLNEGISGIAQEGARNHGLLNVSAKDFFELPIVVPAPAEQKAIASILSTLDGEIASLEALKAKVQEQKRGLMDELLTGRVRVAVNDA